MESLLDMPLWNELKKGLKYERVKGKDSYGNITYSKYVYIPAIIFKEVSAAVKHGEQKSYDGHISYVITNSNIQPMDKIDGLIVESVEEILNFRGKVIAYKGYFRPNQGVNRV